MKTVTLADFRPSRRADGLPWTQARVEASDTPEGDVWEIVQTIALSEIDVDPTMPALRSFTVSAAQPWLRLTFLDAAAGEDESVLVSNSSYPFRPTVAAIARVLRARTYSKGKVDPDDPMQAVAGGALVGDFTDETRPTGVEVEEEITSACVEVVQKTGRLPGEMTASGRSVAELKTAARLERSFIPDQAEDNRSIFQTLRMSASEELESLASNAWLWRLANGGMQ